MSNKKNRKQRRQEHKREVLSSQLQFTTCSGDQYFRALATKALQGKLTPDDWSRLSPAMRKKLDRFSKKSRNFIKDQNITEVLNQLPADAIIKDINLDGGDSKKTPEEENKA